MKKSNKVIVTTIVILCILLLLIGGAFAYTYIATDLLKSDKQLFAKYFMQIILEDGFIDKGINNFNEKKQQTPYETSGEITVDVVYSEESAESILEKVNDLVIRHSGKVDLLNQKVERNIEVDYGNGVTFPVSYRQNGDNFGIQIEKLSEQFIAIKNENLKDLAEKLGADKSIEIPDKIDFEDTTKKFELTEDEKNQLIQIYGDVLLSELTDDIFSRYKTDNSESYTLELSSEKVKNVIIKMLEATKENTLIIDKINEVILEQYSEDEKIDASAIDDMIKSINDENASNIPNLKLTLVQSDKKLNQIILQSGEGTISIVKNKTEDSLKYDINFQMIESVNETTSIWQQESEPAEYNIYFNVQYSGLQDLVNIQENYELGFGSDAEDETIKYDYKIINSTQFKDSISVEELNEDVAVFLNGRGESELTKFLTNVGNKIAEINKEQMAKLGLKEEENPLLYSNPIMLGLVVFNKASEAIDETANNLSNILIQQHNEMFSGYEGESVRGSEVNALIKTIENYNLISEDESLKVKITIDGSEMSDTYKASTASLYVVEAVYNDSGVITEMKVTNK